MCDRAEFPTKQNVVKMVPTRVDYFLFFCLMLAVSFLLCCCGR